MTDDVNVLDAQRQDDPFFEVMYDMENADFERFLERPVQRNLESMHPSDSVGRTRITKQTHRRQQ
jgi:hypothetical protein